ncbi:hypothetical protein TELCIR_09689 [Teladorsagia circumcincta]|uniref:CCR4-Not complex component, Not1 n=1 Tax=Teladorsagia circumcincta TaxID=45464 RepID=A0A2G9UEE0_TELCI|nr:hypothetical protein TELCIR_09689 [Teladorsagia circumcincta]
MRLAPDAVSAPGADTKPSTPNPESEGSSAIVDGTASAVIVPPLHFAYHDINVTSYEGLIPHIKFQLSLPLFQLHPQMKHHVRPALTQAIKELIGPVAERALKIAMIVTETLVRKDFALDPDENNLKKAAFHMAAAELEKRLEAECARRVAARREGTEWHDTTMEKIQAELPARIAIQVGPTRKEHLAIYEQFSGRICGFKPTISEDTSTSVMETVSRAMTLPETAKEVEQLTQQLNSIIKEVDVTMQAQPNLSNKAYQGVGAIRDLLSQLASNPRDSMTVVNLITRSVEYLLHAYHVDSTSKPLDVEWARRLRDLFLGVCRVLLTQFSLVDLSRRITGSIVNVRMDYKWNVEAIEAFPATYEQLFKMQQVQAILRQQAAAAGGTAEPNLDSPLGPAAMDSLVTSNPAATGVPPAVPPSAEEPGMSDKVEIILREWIGLCYTPMAQRNPKEALFQMIVMVFVFQNALFMLQPRRCPSFAYAWLDFVGHRAVIGALLGGNGFAESVDPMKTSAMYTQLLICHLKFLAPFLRNIQLPKSIAVLYKGTLRVLLVILHDFPELLCEYHYVIIDTIPPNCVQLRNLVLSAYPRNMRLPDPFALNFKVSCERFL